jgi:hypothetical protein
MSNKWTIKELEELDDITFAMCILSERRESLNQNAVLAQKLRSAYNTLVELRPANRETTQTAIYEEVKRRNLIEDVRKQLDMVDLHSLTHKDVLGDEEIIARIAGKVDGFYFDSTYWDAFNTFVEEAISEVLAERENTETANQ